MSLSIELYDVGMDAPVPHNYFSDVDDGALTPLHEHIGPTVWAGLLNLIQRCIERGDFGHTFPERCPDSDTLTVGTNEASFELALKAEVPDWPGWTTEPHLSTACDFLEFCYRHIAGVSHRTPHGFFGHDHLRFDQAAGKAEFRAEVNLILQRNRIAFSLEDNGHVRRLLGDPAGTAVIRAQIQTGDELLDTLLTEAREKILSPDSRVRQEALERAWDAWERLKTMHDPDKRRGAKQLLDACASDGELRAVLESEATALTRIGNSLQIRHSETTQTAVTDAAHIDYLFQRLFALLLLALRKNDLMQ